MSLQRISAVVRKESREIMRDRLFLALAFLVPVLLMLLLGLGLSFDVEHIPLAIIDRDRSALSRDYAYRFITSRYFDFQGYARDDRELEPLLATSRIRAAIVIPEHFEKDLLCDRAVAVQILFDGTFPFRALTSKAYVKAINRQANADSLAEYLARKTWLSASQASGATETVRLDVRYLYNQSVKSIWSLGPKLIMVVLLISPPFLTALGVVREKESGAIYNIYASTVSRGEFLCGKLIPYVAVSMINAAILWLIATVLFGAPFRGSIVFLFAGTLLYVICTTGIGLVVSVLVRTQLAAMIVTAILTIVPAVLYSGVLIPIPSLTRTARVVAQLLPAMYYTEIVLGSFLKGVGLHDLWPDVAALAAYAAVLFTEGYSLFHKRPST